MAGLGTAATTLITTRGLFIDDGITSALEFGAGITPWFRLWLYGYVPPTPSGYVAAAGSRPYAPGEIMHLYKELPAEQQYYVIPRDQEAEYFKTRKIATLRVSIAGRNFEGTYSLSESQARKVFKVMNLMNSTETHMKVVIEGFKTVATKATATIRNIKLTRKRK